MPTDRVIVEIITAANMAGVEQAKAGLLGMNASTLALGASLGALIFIGKSAIENTEAQEKAHRSLAQAVAATDDNLHAAIVTHIDTTKETERLTAAQRHLKEVMDGMPTKHKATKVELDHLADAQAAVTKASADLVAAQAKVKTSMASEYIELDGLQAEFDAWAETNKRYIVDQYAAEEALAAFVRAGANAQDAMRELNDALDLSTLRSMSMEDAQKQITLALTGSSKALKILGITTEEYSAIMKNKTLTEEQKHLALLALIETKSKDGRKAQTDLTQSTQALNKDWQDITTKVGPPLLSLITFLVSKVDDFVTALNNLGHNKDWNLALYVGFGKVQDAIVATVAGVKELIAGIKWLIDNGGKVANFLGSSSGGGSGANLAHKRAASGFEGMVSSPTLFLAGEAGPESVNISPMGRGGSGGGGNVYHIHIDQGAYIDGPGIDMLTNRIAQRLAAASGF